jgi:hypothetical protein
MTTTIQTVSDTKKPARRKSRVTPEMLEAREAKRIERLRKSFERVTVKAQSDITKAIKKGKPAYEFESRVPEREACFRDLRSRLTSLKDDERAALAVMPLWESFLSWASTQQLAISLQPRGFGDVTASRWYVAIKAGPVRKVPLRTKGRAVPFGKQQLLGQP